LSAELTKTHTVFWVPN